MTKNIKDQIVSIIDELDDMTIATVRPDGYPQATTVSYVNDGMTIYFGTGADAQKAVNIEKDDRVSATINRDYESWDDIQGISLAAHAKKVTDSNEFEKVGSLLAKKFPQFVNYAPEDAGMDDIVVFRIEPFVVSLLDYTKGFGHTELLEI